MSDSISRRGTMHAGLVSAAALGLLGCTTFGTASTPSTIVLEPNPQALADGVWAFVGVPGDITPETLARHGNGGFIVGPHGVLVIDAGVSLVHGQQRLAAIRRTTSLPILAVLLTHAMQEFIFGAAAFQAEGIPVVMHGDAARLMAARCDTCLKTLRRELGEAPMLGTRVPKADRTFSTEQELLQTLPDIGRRVHVAWGSPSAHTASPGAITVFDTSTATLFAGALLESKTIPDVQDANLDAWQRARQTLRALKPVRIVPGRGPIGDASMIDAVDAYLQDVIKHVHAFVDAGRPLSDAADAIELPAYQAWDRHETTHRRNVSILYLRLERAMMLKP